RMRPLYLRAKFAILLAFSVILAGVLLLASVPVMLDLSPRLQRVEIISYLTYLPILFGLCMAVALWWLRPVWRLLNILQAGEQPSQETLKDARLTALAFPYRFFLMISALVIGVTAIALAIDIFLLDYPPQADILNAMMVTSVGLSLALVVFVGSRRILNPVLTLVPGTTVEREAYLSVRGKIMWVILALTVANLLFLSTFGYARPRRAADDGLLTHYQQVVDRLAGEIAPGLDDQELIAHLSALSLGDDADFVLLDGRGQFSTAPPSLALLPEELEVVTSGERGTFKREGSGTRLVYAPLPGRSQYLLAVYLFDASSIPLLQTNVQVLVGVGVVICVLVLVIGYIIAEDTVRDVRQVTQQLTEIVAGEELHIPPPLNVTSLDEVGQLVGAFNRLRDRVARYTEDLQATLSELREASERQRRLVDTISELSVPVISLSPGVIILPVVGYVDEARARQLTKELLRGIAEYRARVVIIDLTGMSSRVEPGMARHLVRASRATRVAGAEVVITGVHARIARALVQFGFDLSGVTARRDLQGGIEYALTRVTTPTN
ncbi:MAG: HAMP domain-containing protein, partial [Chloroflexota bacterium]|nr:HAMP domain-containing protein [Chloroflexota bacterium]